MKSILPRVLLGMRGVGVEFFSLSQPLLSFRFLNQVMLRGCVSSLTSAAVAHMCG